jgi:hypothetical protein
LIVGPNHGQIDLGCQTPGYVGGQVGDLVEIAGALPDELGMGQVEQGSTLDDQVLAVVEQGSQAAVGADSQADRWQLRFMPGYPGTGSRVNRVSFALGELAATLT